MYDLDGQKYLDLHGNGVHNIGFNNPDVVAAVKKQLDESLAFTPRRYTNIPAVELAQKLCEQSPSGLDRVLYCPGGSEAIEMALLLAKHITGKWKTISFYDCYHGTTWQAAAVGGDPHFTLGQGPMVPGAFHVEFPNYYRNPWGLDHRTEREHIDELYLRQIELILKHHPDMAAIIGTPIASAPHVPSAYFWQRVADLCVEYDALLIFDEIVCGLGRTGTLFACEHYLTPDVVVMGKSLGGGVVPFAGILTHDKYNCLQDRSIGHFTHEKSPLSSAAALAVLNYMQRKQVVNRVKELGEYFRGSLLELQQQFPIIGHIDGKGFLIGIDLVNDAVTKEPAMEAAQQILSYCLDRGLSFKLYEGNMITMRPALIIGKEEIDFIVATLRGAFEAVGQ
ncbi:MAG: aminotransferase class III-fold pyridoxal phosphate-dependent enzyme [Lewinella sp.]|nr:aminotransferase class III-fold pyridoxal phosphate-dependent enzyme [Lewinella sp.]